MNILEGLIREDPKVKSELRKQLLAVIKSAEFTKKFKDDFIAAAERDLTDNMEELMDAAWDTLKNQFSTQLKKKFKLVLEPKES